MVFGNRGETSATGVAFTRDPATGEKLLYGEFLINAQGEDVVAGIRTPQPISKLVRERQGGKKPSMEEAMPKAFAELKAIGERLEQHYRDMQDVEFTVQEGKLFMLQTRSRQAHGGSGAEGRGGHGGRGADRPERSRSARVDPAALDQLLHPTLDPDAPKTEIASGLGASPGAATGEVVFTADEAEKLAAEHRDVILVRTETSPEDIHGMHAARGILTARGGMTSHAAVVARGMGRPCVSGAGSLKIDIAKGEMTGGGVTIKRGEIITIDGAAGKVYKGAVKMRQPELTGDFGTLMGWADAVRTLKVRTNADTPDRCRHGAQIRRRRHRPVPHRAHVLRCRPHHRGAPDDPGRHRSGTRSRAGQAAAHAARRFRGDLQGDGGPAGHHPPARSAVARIPAAQGGGNRGSVQGAAASTPEKLRARAIGLA